VKIGVHVTGNGLARADALVADIRRRAIERVQARLAAREVNAGSTRAQPATGRPTTTPPAR
jgi:hypothetical protein